MNRFFFSFLFSIASIFAESTPESIPQDKTIKNLQKYCSKHPDLWQGFYNLGRTYYQTADFKNAEENFSTALQKCSEPNLQESIFYNLGNTYFKQFSETSKEQQIPILEKCIQNYESALALNPNAEDTKKNLEIAKKLLEKLKKEQQQQNKNQNKNKEGKKDSSDQRNHKDSSNFDKNEDKKDQQHQGPTSANQNNQAQEQKMNPSESSGEKKVPQSPKQQEMENILQKEKNNERILPVNFSKNQKSSQDKILKDW